MMRVTAAQGGEVADFLGAFALVERSQRYLFVQNEREIDGRVQRVWDLPGGRVEAGELLQEALCRELLEETGLEVVGPPEFVFVQEGERAARDERSYAWRSFFFRVEAVGDPAPHNEVLDVRWMSPTQVAEECDAPYHDSFRQWLQRGGNYFVSRWRDADDRA